MSRLAFLEMLFLLCCFISSKRFALLYCGSSTIWNYRHQADIYTIYRQLLNHGFNKTNIVLYAYDDIATDYSNPFKGQVFHSDDHKMNVYPGSDAINYRRSTITAQAFYDAISNLPTSSEDYVFIYYINHGGPGFLGTPENGPDILADELAKSFSVAAERNLYKKCLFFIEACYSGSVAQFLTAPNLAIITAANESEQSNPDNYDIILDNYLSNEFSNRVIKLFDQDSSLKVEEAYNTLKKETKLSHVMYYGDDSIKNLSLSTFIGKLDNTTLELSNNESVIEPIQPRAATEKILRFHAEKSLAGVRTRARLQLIRNKALSERLEIILEMLVRHLDPLNLDQIMHDTESKFTKTYFSVLPIFMKKVGEINPDDYGRLSVIKALAARHSADYIIQGINNVII